jgi:nucleoporin NDC1
MRTIFLVVLPLIQTISHLYGGYDTVTLPVGSTPKKAPAGSSSLRFVDAIPVNGRMAVVSVGQVAVTIAIGTIVYLGGLHTLFWRLQYSIARTLFLVPKGNGPRTLAMGDFIRVLGQSMFQGMLLVLLWSTVNTLFDFYISKEPLKKDLPITNDSKDPNGSLLIGLKSKKEIPKVSL